MARSRRNTLHPSQKKMILDFLGCPVNDLPSSIKEIDSMIEAQQRRNYDEYLKAYNIIVNKKFSDTPQQKIIPFADAAKILHDEVDALEKSALKMVGEQFASKAESLVGAVQKEHADLIFKIAAEMSEAIEKHAKKFNILAVQVGKEKPKPVKGVVPEEFHRLLQLASSRINILMVGPTGCGKTFVSSKIAEALGLDFSSQSCSAGVSESAFTGWLIPVGAGGKFAYVSSEFVRIYENGGVFLFDELDASDPNVLVFLNQAIANDHFVLPQRHENPKVKKHKDFVCVAAANTNGSGADTLYHGRNSLDEATLDRFRVGTVNMSYSAIVEETIIHPEILIWGRKIRDAIARHRLNRVMSTRTMIDATTMFVSHGWGISDIQSGYFASWSNEEKSMLRNSGVTI